jgi:hypothetical protein
VIAKIVAWPATVTGTLVTPAHVAVGLVDVSGTYCATFAVGKETVIALGENES